MKKYLIISLFLFSCTQNSVKKNDFIFSEKMSFNKFKIKLKEYAIKNPYPNIDN